jgi:hypothetical protein
VAAMSTADAAASPGDAGVTLLLPRPVSF